MLSRSPVSTSLVRIISSSRTRFMSTNSAQTVRSTAASGSQVYESKRAVDEYLLFHYGKDSDLAPFPVGIDFALHFAQRSTKIGVDCLKNHGGKTGRALDIGCAVGGLSFELTKHFDEVVGIDFSHHFVQAANEMKEKGRMKYNILKQGEIFYAEEAVIPAEINRSKAHFFQGDACNLSPELGKFDFIIGSNLLCRLPDPRKFLQDIPNFLAPGGVLALISPYSWLEEYTAKERWLGARVGPATGKPRESFEVVKEILEHPGSSENALRLVHRENIPFLIREHERKFQLGVSDYNIWARP